MAHETDFRPVDWTDEQVETFWSFHARQARERPGRSWYFSESAGRYLATYLQLYARLNRGGAFLDFGCGPGFFLETLSRRGRGRLRLFGLEFSEQSATEARERLQGCAGVAGVVCIPTLPAPWPDASFDFVSSIEVVEHLDDEKLDGFLSEAHRLLKPGGTLFITTPNEEDLAVERIACPHCRHFFHRWQHVRSWSVTSLREHVALYGFEPIKVEPVAWEPTPKRWVKRLLGRRFYRMAGLFRRRG